jgi:hypothetical protein
MFRNGGVLGRFRTLAVGALAAIPAVALAQTCPLTTAPTGGFGTLARPGGPVLFRSGLAVNADGAPNAYHRGIGPNVTDPGLLNICNGADVLERRGNSLVNRYPDFGVPGSSQRCKADYFTLRNRGFPTCDTGLCLRIYGFVATPRACGFGRGNDCGVPVAQTDGKGQPTDFWISATSWFDHARPATDPARYLDARFIPHIVLPGGEGGPFGTARGVRLGDLALLAWQGRATFAVFADAGPSSKLGEASPAAINRLRGQADSPTRRGAPIPPATPVTTLLFPGTRQLLGPGIPADAAAIRQAGDRALAAAGGLAAFRSCPGLAGPLTIAER